jgi:hypothetical protein
VSNGGKAYVVICNQPPGLKPRITVNKIPTKEGMKSNTKGYRFSTKSTDTTSGRGFGIKVLHVFVGTEGKQVLAGKEEFKGRQSPTSYRILRNHISQADEMEKYIDFAEVGIDKDKFVKGLFSYETLWHKENANPGNPEYILTREYMADDNNCDWTRYTYIRPSQMGSGYSSFEPMQDLVDAYWSIDGKTLPEIPSEETRRARFADMWMKYFAEPVGETYKSVAPAVFREKVPTLDIKSIPYMQEFRNRDSRLYASILFPLKGWQETDFSGDFYYMWDPLKAGSDGNESWTGYNYRKLVSLTPYQGWQSVEDYPIIRYAEVLLTYAFLLSA